MNYRHAFHAGNFADVHKHAVLARILTHLRLKPAAFRVVDTHAGAGRYDLFGSEPGRSGEWREGIARVFAAAKPRDAQTLLAPYLDAVAASNSGGDELRFYPGSPLIVRHLLRSEDRLIACELEPQAAASLAAALRGDSRTKALTIDGWTALNAYVPPKERRGLVLIDPPFEDPTEFARLSRVLDGAYRKWPTGIYVMWYPIKDRVGPDALARRLQRLIMPQLLRCELSLAAPHTPGGLVGSGLIVVNPPFTLQADLRVLMPALRALIAPQGAFRIDWLAQDR
jgi:23S rRNA (adenine2030-N6)-methyltransferase